MEVGGVQVIIQPLGSDCKSTLQPSNERFVNVGPFVVSGRANDGIDSAERTFARRPTSTARLVEAPVDAQIDRFQQQSVRAI